MRSVENTHWHQPLLLDFDSETMPDWMGMPKDEDLPSTFSVEYVRGTEEARETQMPNQIMVISPYWVEALGAWVFDDPKTGLDQTVCHGIPEMIDSLVKDIPNAKSGFRMLFSAGPFPGYQRKLVWCGEEMGGNWYASDDPPMEGLALPSVVPLLRPSSPRTVREGRSEGVNGLMSIGDG